jgi:hypothetical protein
MEKKNWNTAIITIIISFLFVGCLAAITVYGNSHNTGSPQTLIRDTIPGESNQPQEVTVDIPVDDVAPEEVTTPEAPLEILSLDEAAAQTANIVAIDDPLNGTVRYEYIDPENPQTETEEDSDETVDITQGFNLNSSDLTAQGADIFTMMLKSYGDVDSIRYVKQKLTYPTKEQVVSFLMNDSTDTRALTDNKSVIAVAKSATEDYEFHNQIVLLVMKNGQMFAVNRFPLADNTTMYVDCSRIAGVDTTGKNADRILDVGGNKSITATSPYITDITYTYPSVEVDYGITLWEI